MAKETPHNYQEKQLQKVVCCGGFGEHLQAAQSCFAFAARLHLELGQPALAAGLCLELGSALRDMGQPGQAAPHFQRAVELLAAAQLPLEALRCLGQLASCLLLGRDHDGALAFQRAVELLAAAQLPLEALRCLGQLASCLLLGRDHDGALAVLTQAQLLAQAGPSPPSGAFLEVLVHCEVSRVLLLLLLQPPPPKLLPEHARTLEKYCWEAFESGAGAGAGQLPQAAYLPPGLFLLLQSAVMACQEKDLEALKVLQAELWPLLSPEQNHLLHLVLQEMISPSGQGV
ncbi:PREDICTED: factor VIII intron 22 protein-like [Gavialis gangeticus]|uniref:factor VIII intron 22 protein-like n=1 Tax=Gavialis gangeticus TaxID=94835 RepID=UPI00092E6F2D|nr:PREDICTED: factor VIII intron 22 protein-like [Gavialis gangeticus]